jgi:hypothetical protein
MQLNIWENYKREKSARENPVNTRNLTNKEGSLDMFHNKKMWTIKVAHLKVGVEAIQLKVMSTCETNTMTEQTWVVTKALWHKTSLSLLDQDHMNNDQIHKSREV